MIASRGSCPRAALRARSGRATSVRRDLVQCNDVIVRASRFLRVESSEGDHPVTPLELLFDLVFVFAITNVTALMAHELTGRGMLRGLVVIALLWWAWCSYAWLGNQARADEGIVRAGLVTAMGAMFLVALAIPHTWDDAHESGWSNALLLAVALSVVRGVHLAVYAIAARGDQALRRTLMRTVWPVAAAALLLVVGAVLGGAAQTVLWLSALVVDYVGVYLSGAEWRLPSPAHFAERHGLMIIIALGESLVSIGVGLGDAAGDRTCSGGRAARSARRGQSVVDIFRRRRAGRRTRARRQDRGRPDPTGPGLVHLSPSADGGRDHLRGPGTEADRRHGRRTRAPMDPEHRFRSRRCWPCTAASRSICWPTSPSGCAISDRSTARGWSPRWSCCWRRWPCVPCRPSRSSGS